MRTMLIAATGITGIILAFILLNAEKPKEAEETDLSASEHQLASMLGPASKSDPLAMAEYEWLLYRDPQTGKIPRGIHAREMAFTSGLPQRGELIFSNNPGRAWGTMARGEVDGWRSLGPNFNGGRTRAVGIDIEGRYILAGSVSGGMFKEDNEGELRWRKVTPPDLNQNVTGLIQDAREGKSHIWYYTTGEMRGGAGGGPFRNTMGGGVYKSIDSGETWMLLPSTAGNGPAEFDSPFEMTWRIVVDTTAPLSQEIIYVAGFGAIMRSDDGGENWSEVLGDAQVNPSLYTDIVMTSDGTFYAAIGDIRPRQSSITTGATDHGIWRSENGVDWTDITPEDWPTRFERTVLASAPSDPALLYILASTPGSGFRDHTLHRYRYLSGNGSGDGGEWEDRSQNIPDDPQTDDSWGNDYRSFNGYCLSIDVHPENPDFVILGGTNLYRSTDGFSSGDWDRIGGYRTDYANWAFSPYRAWYYGHHPDQHGLKFWPGDPDIAFSFTDGGVHLSFDITADSVEWLWVDDNYITTQFYSVAIDPDTPGDELIVGGTQDNNTFVRTRKDFGFYPMYAGDGAYCAVDRSTESFYVSNIDGQLWRITMDAAGEPDSGTYILPATSLDYFTFFPWRLDPNNTTMLYLGAGKAIWRNSDVSEIPKIAGDKTPSMVNWKELNNTRGKVLDNLEMISAIGVSTTPAHRLYYGRMNGTVFRIDHADEGDPVPVEITGKDFPPGFVSCIMVDPDDADRVIIVFSNYNVRSLFLTEDGGETWNDIGGNLEENRDGTGDGPACKWLELMRRGDETIYLLGTTTGLFSTTRLEGEATIWKREGAESIGTVGVHQIAVRNPDGKVVVATHGNGLYESTFTSGVVNHGAEANAAIALHQIHPNPFIGETTIRFSLLEQSASEQPVRLEVFNVRGESVGVLRDERLSAGNHAVQFDARDLPSGLYIVQLRAGEKTLVRSITKH